MGGPRAPRRAPVRYAYSKSRARASPGVGQRLEALYLLPGRFRPPQMYRDLSAGLE
jgi:hypothetical protein